MSIEHIQKIPLGIYSESCQEAIPAIFTEIWQTIFAQLDWQKQALVSLTCRQFYLILKPMLPSAIMNEYAVGKREWEHFFGDVSKVPSLPANISSILKSPCPFWPGKKVHETHILVLIPHKVDGQPFTLASLKLMIEKPKQGSAMRISYYRGKLHHQHGTKPVDAAHWVLITREVIPGSLNQDFTDQRALLSRIGEGYYEVPKTLDAATAILLFCFAKGDKLFQETATQCQEKIERRDGQKNIHVGYVFYFLNAWWLDIAHKIDKSSTIGLAAARKL